MAEFLKAVDTLVVNYGLHEPNASKWYSAMHTFMDQVTRLFPGLSTARTQPTRSKRTLL